MKIRNGFVSNSSSSSFICDITGEEVQGMDLCLEDAEMYICECDHTFLEEYLIGELPEDLEEGRYCIPSANCPICTFTYITESDLVLYIQKHYGITFDQAFAYMKEKNKRLRKMRNIYYIELLAKEKGISKLKLTDEIKSKFDSLEEFDKYIEGR